MQGRRRTGEVDDGEVNDELGDLHGGEVLLPPDLAATSRSPVVVIYVSNGRSAHVEPVYHSARTHEDVDGEVQDDGHPLDGGVSIELGEAEQCGRRVMEDVKEGKRLLLEGEEGGVEEFKVIERVIN